LENITSQVEVLFEEVGDQHHAAFSDVDGADPEWPLWYAERLADRLPSVLSTDLTKSEIVYLLVHLGKVQEHEAPDMPWTRFYAEYFAREYAKGDPG
jgi:hypothetical protein